MVFSDSAGLRGWTGGIGGKFAASSAGLAAGSRLPQVSAAVRLGGKGERSGDDDGGQEGNDG